MVLYIKPVNEMADMTDQNLILQGLRRLSLDRYGVSEDALELNAGCYLEDRLEGVRHLSVYGLLRSHKQVFVRLKTRTYIRLFGGDAISQPSMYAHPGASMSYRPVRPQSGTGFTRVDCFI